LTKYAFIEYSCCSFVRSNPSAERAASDSFANLAGDALSIFMAGFCYGLPVKRQGAAIRKIAEKAPEMLVTIDRSLN
jgi:hypothetical protein